MSTTHRIKLAEKACMDCGTGIYASSERCRSCNRKRLKKWTREAVIKAIQDWAEIHGRAPTATEWYHAGKNGEHPSFSTVYGPGSPFPKWADAIEAAGFRRPGQRAGRNSSPNRARLGWIPLRNQVNPERKWKKR